MAPPRGMPRQREGDVHPQLLNLLVALARNARQRRGITNRVQPDGPVNTQTPPAPPLPNAKRRPIPKILPFPNARPGMPPWGGPWTSHNHPDSWNHGWGRYS